SAFSGGAALSGVLGVGADVRGHQPAGFVLVVGGYGVECVEWVEVADGLVPGENVGFADCAVVERGYFGEHGGGFLRCHRVISNRCCWSSRAWTRAPAASASATRWSAVDGRAAAGDALAPLPRWAARRSWSYFSRSFGIERMLERQNSSLWHQSMAPMICASVRPSMSSMRRAASSHRLLTVGRLQPLASMRSARC